MAKAVVRLQAVRLAFVFGTVLLLGRAVQVQLIDGGRYSEAAVAQQTDSVVLPARRGTIFDREGIPLASTLEKYHVGFAPNELNDPEQDARAIAGSLGLPLQEVRRSLRQTWVYFHGPFTSSQVQPLRSVRGVHLHDPEFERFYPDPDLARPVLGRPAGDGQPAGGIERVLDSWLAGTPGNAVVLTDMQGQRYESPSRLGSFPVPGHDVYLTIDAGLQEIVENALDEALQRFDASSGDVVVLDPKTGEILALTSRTIDGRSTTNAITSVYEPGSTAKIFTAAALLTEGLVSPTDLVWGEEGEFRTEHRVIHDVHESGWLTLRQTIERSSNIGIVKFGDRLSAVSLYEMLRRFGLGAPTGIEFPIESAGILNRPDRWSGVTRGSLAMGYEVSVTPLQLALAYAAIGNGGVLMRPTLVREIRAPGGEVRFALTPEPIRRAVSNAIAAELLSALHGVVYDGGTGDSAALQTYRVAGKTGTARRAGPSGYIEGAYWASFASLFPADDPQLVMVVKLEDPKATYAQATAAPLTRIVLEQVLAAQTGALDRTRLSNVTPMGGANPTTTADMALVRVPWPLLESDESLEHTNVPDLAGLSARAAARELHDLGLRATVSGWGVVMSSDPVAGTSVLQRTVVRVFCEDPEGS